MADDKPISTSVRIQPKTWAMLRAAGRQMRPSSSVSKLVSNVMDDIVSGRIEVPWLQEALRHAPSDEILQAAVEMRHPRAKEPTAAAPSSDDHDLDLGDLFEPETEEPDLPTEVRGLTGRWNEGLPRGFVVSFRDLDQKDPRVARNKARVASLGRSVDPSVGLEMLEEGKIDPRQFRDAVGVREVMAMIQGMEDEDPARKRIMAMAYADVRRERAAMIDLARAEEPRLSEREEMLPPREKFRAMVARGVDRARLKEFLLLEFDARDCPKCGEPDLNGDPSFFGLVNPDGRIKCGRCRAFMDAGAELPLRE